MPSSAVRTATAEEPMLRATQVELIDGLVAWGLPGVGRLSAGPDGGRFDRTHAHCETSSIGGGASGRAAARTAARDGDRVILVDEGPVIEDAAALGALADLRLLPKATALGVYDHGYVVVAERTPSPTDRGPDVAHPGRSHRARNRRHRATDRLRRRRPARDHARIGGRAATSAGTASGRAIGRSSSRPTTRPTRSRCTFRGRCRGRRSRRRPGRRGRRRHGADADGRLAAVDIGTVDGRGPTRTWRPTCCWCPAAGTRTSASGASPAARSASTTGSPRSCRTGRSVTCAPSAPQPATVFPTSTRCGSCRRPIADAPDAWDRHYVDLQRDSTVGHLRRALGAGLTSIEHVKRYTTIGTASDQGKTSGVLASAIAAALLGEDVGSVGVPTYRPPYTPISFAMAAGRERGPLLDPVRTTPIHPWHVAAGAVFEDVGQWKRPRYFPASRRGDGRRGPARVRSGTDRRGRHGRDDPRQDRHPGPRRRRLPRPHLRQHASRRSRSDRAGTA